MIIKRATLKFYFFINIPIIITLFLSIIIKPNSKILRANYYADAQKQLIKHFNMLAYIYFHQWYPSVHH